MYSQEQIDKKLENRPIKRIGKYINIKQHILFKCLIEACEYEWLAIPDGVIRGNGCPKCAGNETLTNEYIDEAIKNRNLKRVDNYTGNNHTCIRFKCLVINCNYEWMVTPHSILQGHGCPKCAGNQKLTNVDVDKRIEDLEIQRIGDYINRNTPIEFKCLNCKYQWLTRPNNPLRGRGCPICNTPGKNEKRIFDILTSYGIKFKHNYAIKNINKNENRLFKVDFYFSDINLIIEYNGKQHYDASTCFGSVSKEKSVKRLINQQNRDKYVENFCLDNNLHLIWIDGRDYWGKTLVSFLKTDILPLINKYNEVNQ